MSKEKDTSISFGLGLLAGVVGGIIAAIMYAPKSGEETRNDLNDKIKTIKKRFPKEIEQIKKTSIRTIEKTKVALENLYEDINESLKAQKMANAKLLEAKSLKERN